MPEKTAQKEPGKKPVPSKKPKPQQEVVVQIPLSELHPFPDHPFQVREDASMQETAESVKEYGVLVPALARPREDGGYELIAGHRRKHACELAGLTTMPVIVRNIDRDAATIIMVDSNLQRENILPSERAKAYKMKMEAIKRQGARTDLTSSKISAKFRSDDEVGQEAGVSGDTIRNYIALTQLVPELQQMVDEKKIALSPAYQIAALTPKEQGLLLETIDSEQATPSLSQAQRMKKLSQSGELNEDTMLSIMMEQKKPEKSDITLSGEKLRKYFPRSYTPFQIENTIFKLLDAWQKKRQRDQSRWVDRQFVCPLFSCPEGGTHVYQHVQIHPQGCELPALHRVCEKAGMHLVVAKSAHLRFRRWRKLRSLPCSSSPRKVCDFAGAPNLPVAGRAHRGRCGRLSGSSLRDIPPRTPPVPAPESAYQALSRKPLEQRAA